MILADTPGGRDDSLSAGSGLVAGKDIDGVGSMSSLTEFADNGYAVVAF